MGGVGRALLREVGAAARDLIEAVGGDQRREDREDHEDGDDDHPGPEDRLRDPLRLADRSQPTRQPQALHPYLTRGSMKALIRSISSETMTTATANTVTMPCTA